MTRCGLLQSWCVGLDVYVFLPKRVLPAHNVTRVKKKNKKNLRNHGISWVYVAPQKYDTSWGHFAEISKGERETFLFSSSLRTKIRVTVGYSIVLVTVEKRARGWNASRPKIVVRRKMARRELGTLVTYDMTKKKKCTSSSDVRNSLEKISKASNEEDLVENFSENLGEATQRLHVGSQCLEKCRNALWRRKFPTSSDIGPFFFSVSESNFSPLAQGKA